LSWFNDRLSSLGFRSYSDYLKSDHWKKFRRLYQISSSPQRCLVCGRVDYELHHTNYFRLGRETLSDVMPLCRTHHQEVHQWLDKKNLWVKDSYKAVQDLKRRFLGR
jgi:hypothetical protein